MKSVRLRLFTLGFALACLSDCACSKRAEPPTGSSGGSAANPGSRATRRAPCLAVLGSSTAAGFGVGNPAMTWVGRYAAYVSRTHPGLTIKNLAVSGFSTFQVLPTGSSHRKGVPRVDPDHNVTAALAEHPGAIIVNLPSNDAAMGITVEETMKNLRAVVASAKGSGVPTWVTTPQPRALDARGLALLEGLRDAVLGELKDRSLNFWTPLAAADGTPLPSLNQGDGIHPNPEGHRLLFEVVKAADVPGHLETTEARAHD